MHALLHTTQGDVAFREFFRRDDPYTIPDDGRQYVMAGHEMPTFKSTRHEDNKTEEAIPAVVSNDEDRNWGIETLARPTGDYYTITDDRQWWFLEFWNWASRRLLPLGKWEDQYTNKFGITYDIYTPGSLLALYAGMIMRSKSHTDAKPVESGARDVVTKRNMNQLASKNWSWLCRPTSGALLRVLSRNGTRLKIEAIDIDKDSKLPMPRPQDLPPYLYYFGTQVHVGGKVSRYPDVKNMFVFHGYPEEGTAMPLVAPGGYFWINANAVVNLSPGDIWQPYYTPAEK